MPQAGSGGGSGTGTGITDGGFVEPPIVTTTATGDVSIKGKVKPGSFGKIVVPIASVQAGRQYTFRYTPQFSQLAQQGKLAMVGFGFKTNNDFHIVGLRGDGSTGIHKYQVYGTPPNGWNKDAGQTTNDGGASANGTQAGPNYIRLVISADGATYKFQSSANGSTWIDEFTGQTPSPFSNVSGVQTFGIALWFNNADAGPFSIAIDQIADLFTPGTLNPSDKASTISLINANLTARQEGGSNAWASVRSQTSHNSVKYYWEWTIGQKGANAGDAGFLNASAPLEGGFNSFVGCDLNGIGLVTTGQVYQNLTGTTYLSTIANGDICGLAIDIDAHLLWVRNGSGNWNGSGTDDPATGAGGISLPSGLNSGAVYAGISVYSVNDNSTANFGGSAFSQTPPSGFNAWG
ncbi:hypothetical protein [Mesorhizobium sp. B2-7-1]|uniref:hypothetical protein n=1 Tax=Mesorhizobium sp. B2-7-1 TaxID=2589909 RepID=UPI00112B2A35|nr:hypothetical protein [Mesorhizobium sp. B2-7-1]TPJ46847.1 hypothetical protein FJ471_31430 [Mesorhizobium sp. B2-7-1]